MSSVAVAPTGAGMRAPSEAGNRLEVELISGLAAAARVWRSAEAGGAEYSPYQRFDWVAAFVSTVTPQADIRLGSVSDSSGRPLLLLPLAIEREAGLTIATTIGGKHANFNLPIFPEAGGTTLSGPDLLDALRRLAAGTNIDAFVLPSVPRLWAGSPNPLAAFGTASPSDAYQVRLEPDPDANAQRSMSNEARKRLRNKERGLAKLGPVAFLQARTESEVDRVLGAFLRQKEERFRELGIPDPFADPAVHAFLRKAALDRQSDGCPALELYALTVGEHVTAVLGGAADPKRLSGMFISFAACKEATKFSPGDILVSRVVREQCVRGRAFFDLGVGEARYKRTFCDETVELVDVFLPVSTRGRIYSLARRGVAGLKRRVKQNPSAMALVARLRRVKAAA